MRSLERDYLDNYLTNLWRWKIGLEERSLEKPDLDVVKKTQWSERFEQEQRVRLMMGAFRYGLFGETGKPKFDSISSAIRRLEEYKRTGNQELLVDTANLCMVEFIERSHPNAHFSSTAESDEHAKSINT